MFSLPLIAERQFSALLADRVAGYPVFNAFSVQAFGIPAIVVKAGRFKEESPFTHVYNGELSISIITQIDDVADPIAAHDAAVAAVYDILSDQDGVMSGVNAATFHLWGYYSTDYDQEIFEKDGARGLVTVLEYSISCQSLGVIA